MIQTDKETPKAVVACKLHGHKETLQLISSKVFISWGYNISVLESLKDSQQITYLYMLATS